MNNKNKYINFNDKRIPIGKRKQAYVKWAVSKGTDLEVAKFQANKKFGFEKKWKELVVIIWDTGGAADHSDFWQGIYDSTKYERERSERVNYIEAVNFEHMKDLKKQYESEGVKIICLCCTP